MKTPRITPQLTAAARTVLSMAIDNSCSCPVEHRDHRGYLGHARDCWVHSNRKEIKRVAHHFSINPENL